MGAYAALDWTEKALEEIEKRIREIYSRASKEIGQAWKDYMEEQDDRIDALGKAYGAAKQGGDPDEIRAAGIAVSKAKQEKTIMNRHYQNLTNQLALDLTRVNEIAVAYVNGRLPEIYAVSYNDVAVDLMNDLGGEIRFDLVDQSTIRRLAAEEADLLPYKKINKPKDLRWNVSKINAEVTQGILQGESIPNIAKRFEKVLGMNESAAIRNARTTVTSAENKGRIDMMHDAEDAGVIMNKGWSSARDKRVRKSHQLLDNGEFIGMDEEFSNGLQYPGDPDGDPEEVYNCRCALIYEIVGFQRR